MITRLIFACLSLTSKNVGRVIDAPKLVVLVDQMRYDYLTRFYNQFT
ncbi:hypothetical protein [Aquimarina muelleri]|uniref:Uncharacterized protein n=1 Tax=Aquimarina muelleri TaxID=279356 RepID=A0A918JSY2_9FLAO|nr:hypothetical protein [Aquimarina muelleri]MCX2764351.1 hypothetical protein [Aquimarina muelleri]GGX04951.1 hypothetical protein GCM10007384_03260 [Aquimarina muelleri]